MTRADFIELRRLARLDAWRRQFKEAGCSGKFRFASPQQARKGIRPRLKGQVSVYHCPYCGAYHVGSKKPRGPRHDRPAA